MARPKKIARTGVAVVRLPEGCSCCGKSATIIAEGTQRLFCDDCAARSLVKGRRIGRGR